MRTAYFLSMLLASAFLGGAPATSAATFATLHQFCKQAIPCKGGAGPLESPLVPDGAGNFFGTVQNFGRLGGGILYELRDGTKFHKLFDFPAVVAPRGPLVRDVDGNLYGIEGNGATGAGGIFKLHPRNATLTDWTFETLYTLCSAGGNECPDGQTPVELTYEGAGSGMPYDGLSPLYGSTVFGGSAGSGTVFQLARKHGTWSETVLYSFCSVAGCTDGQWPAYALLFGNGGTLYGMTTAGGDAGQGAVFRLRPNAKRTKWKQSIVYSLCQQANCADGAQGAGLTIDSMDTLYGTASAGGDAGLGTLFRIAADGKFTRLYSFCQQPSCADGSGPLAGPTLAPDGTIYGVTSLDSRVFSFEPQNSTYSLLHTFCTDQKCSDGFEPLSPLTLDTGGRLLGTTAFGGSKHSGGTVFSLTP